MKLFRTTSPRAGRDRGDILVEVVLAIGLIAIFSLGILGLSAQTNAVQRTAVNHGIAIQAAQGALEKARATSWDKVGTPAPPAVGLLPSGTVAVTGGTLPATSTTIVRKTQITARTAVGWSNAPLDGSGFGKKIVVVEVSWFDKPGVAATKHTVRQQSIITPGIGDAAPSTVPGA